MRIVVALGGNALLKRGEPMTAEVQRRNVADRGGGPGAGRARPSAGDQPRQRSAGRAARAPGRGLQAGRGLSARRARRRNRGHDRLHDRAGARQPAAVRGALRHAPDHGRGRPGRSGLQEPDQVRGPVYEKAVADRIAEEKGWIVKRTATSGGGWCRRPSPSASSRSAR